jgi:hypothetical protein
MTVPPAPEVHAVWHVGPAPAAATSTWTLLGQDGGQSIDLGDDILFVFCDTLLKPAGAAPRDRGRFVANCCALGERGRLSDALKRLRYATDADGWPRELLPATSLERLSGLRFWPEHGIAIDGRVYLYYLGIQQLDRRDTWAFRNVGTGLAIVDPLSGEAERLSWNTDWCLWPAGPTDRHGGVQVLREDEHVYVFGSCRDGADVQARLSRVPAECIADPSAYEHLASPVPTWSRMASDACNLGPSGHEFSVSFNRHLGGYLMCYVDAVGRSLYLRRADALWGPYSKPVCLGMVPLDPRNEMAALAFEHPAFAADGGRTVSLSYSQAHFVQNGLVNVRFA